jgi:phage/plasmid-like protein (TIGR03299 family)
MQEQTQNMGWNEALSEYGIDFSVEKVPVVVGLDRPGQYYTSNRYGRLVPNLFSIVRSDTGLPLPGVGVNGSYQCIQTQTYADIGNRICGDLGAQFVKGGAWKGGKVVYLQAKLPGAIRVRGTDDLIDKYLTFVTSHDGSTAFMLMPTTLRIFCQNQMAALNRAARDGIKIRHTRSAESRLEMADQKIMEILNAYNMFEEKVNHLASRRFNDIDMSLALFAAFGVKDDVQLADVPTRTRKNMELVRANFEAGAGIDESNRGTAWAAFNAFSEFSSHQRSLRKTTDKFESNILGSGALFTHKALRSIENVLGR